MQHLAFNKPHLTTLYPLMLVVFYLALLKAT